MVSSSSAAHCSNGDYGVGVVGPHLCLTGAINGSMLFRVSLQSYGQGESSGGAVVVACLASKGTIVAMAWSPPPWCCARARERE